MTNAETLSRRAILRALLKHARLDGMPSSMAHRVVDWVKTLDLKAEVYGEPLLDDPVKAAAFLYRISADYV